MLGALGSFHEIPPLGALAFRPAAPARAPALDARLQERIGGSWGRDVADNAIENFWGATFAACPLPCPGYARWIL